MRFVEDVLRGKKYELPPPMRGTSRASRLRERGHPMSTETILIIVVLVLLLGGGGFYWRGRR
jgi:hypothetical protein